jgi:hypothetical protein
MPVGHEDHRGVPVTPSVSFGRVHQPLNLGLGEVLASAQVAVGRPSRANCSLYGGWRDQSEVPLGHGNRLVGFIDCPINSRYLDSLSMEQMHLPASA